MEVAAGCRVAAEGCQGVLVAVRMEAATPEAALATAARAETAVLEAGLQAVVLEAVEGRHPLAAEGLKVAAGHLGMM